MRKKYFFRFVSGFTTKQLVRINTNCSMNQFWIVFLTLKMILITTNHAKVGIRYLNELSQMYIF